jgi:hypothetical protein
MTLAGFSGASPHTHASIQSAGSHAQSKHESSTNGGASGSQNASS